MSSSKNTDGTSTQVQREEIRYRDISWGDFEGPIPTNHSQSALAYTGIHLQQGRDLVTRDWASNRENTTVTINYNPNQVSIYGFMETDQSWKASWLIDDEAASSNFGTETDIDLERAKLLSHEQIHFLNAHTVAEIYDPIAKAAVPSNSYTESFSSGNAEENERRILEIYTTKREELGQTLLAIRQTAVDELDRIQDIYDSDTNHSTNEASQNSWHDDYANTFEEARNRPTPAE